MGDLTPTSSSFYWFPQSEEQVPLKHWYEARTLALTTTGNINAGTADDEEQEEEASEHDVFNGGIMGHGIGFSRILAGLPGLYDRPPNQTALTAAVSPNLQACHWALDCAAAHQILI